MYKFVLTNGRTIVTNNPRLAKLNGWKVRALFVRSDITGKYFSVDISHLVRK